MAVDLRPIRIETLEHAVGVMNRSSQGLSFQFNLDAAQLLALCRFWRISYRHSYLAYSGGEPAGIVLNSVDSDRSGAYSFYWGVVPEHRRGRLAMSLAHAFLDQVRAEGYAQAHADAAVDSPVRIYERLGYRPGEPMVELRLDRLEPAASSASDGIRTVDVSEFLDGPSWQRTPRCWTERPEFLRKAAPFLEFAILKTRGWAPLRMALTRWSGETSLMWIDPQINSDALRLLLRWLAANGYAAPVTASYVPQGGPVRAVLESAGFAAGKRTMPMVLDL